MTRDKIQWFCNWAPSLGALEGTAEQVWGTPIYEYKKHKYLNLIQFGCYDLRDYFTLWRHRGRKAILWAGSDIRNLQSGFLFNEGKLKLLSKLFKHSFLKQIYGILNATEHWVENEVEQKALAEMGLFSKVCPSFLGNVDDFPLLFIPSKTIRLYTSVSGNNFELYGWDKIPELAIQNPSVEFHLYGSTTPIPFLFPANVYLHGRVSKEVMNSEIKHMTGALRLTKFDGFSEILAKSVLWGQWPVSTISYPHMLSPDSIHLLSIISVPNLEGRNYYLNILNNYIWNVQKH